MQTVAALGLWNVIVPLFFWVPAFAIVAGLLGLSTVRRVRKQLVAVGHPTRLTTALGGIALLVLLPVASGFFGGSFALKRGLGKLIEHGGDRVVGWSVTRGASSMQAALGIQDPKKKLPAAELRAMISAQLAGNEHADTLPAARIGSPLLALILMPRILERAFWVACDKALAHVGREITWDELVIGARLAIGASGHLIFRHAAAQLYAASHADLIAIAILMVLSHGVLLGVVWQRCRKRLKVSA